MKSYNHGVMIMKWFRRKKVIENLDKIPKVCFYENVERPEDKAKFKLLEEKLLTEYHFLCLKCDNKWSNKSIHKPTGVEICPRCSHMRCGKDIHHKIDRCDIISAINDCDQYACRECYPEYFSKPKEEKEMKCPCGKDMPKNHVDICSYECYKKYYHKCKTLGCCETIDINLTYCVSCAGDKPEKTLCFKCDARGSYVNSWGDWKITPNCSRCHDESKEEPKMKEFDLRPYEVKSPSQVVTKYFIEIEKAYIKEFEMFNGIGYGSQLEAAKALVNILDRHQEACKQRVFKINILKKDTVFEWQFSDIEIGCFFKVKGDSELTNIRLKVSSMHSAKVAPAHITNNKYITTSVLREPIQPYDKSEVITNVYKCDELYKHFMIEELKS